MKRLDTLEMYCIGSQARLARRFKRTVKVQYLYLEVRGAENERSCLAFKFLFDDLFAPKWF